jgi:hypothetical protein
VSQRSAPRQLLLLLAALGLFALAGCGSSDSEAGDGTTATTATTAGSVASDEGAGSDSDEGAAVSCPDEAAVADAVGADVALDPMSGGVDGCNYYGEAGSPDAEVSVNLLVEQPTSMTIEDVERNLPVDRVEGVGDAAWEVVRPGGIVQFGAFEGDRYVTVTISGASEDVAMGRAVYELVP